MVRWMGMFGVAVLLSACGGGGGGNDNDNLVDLGTFPAASVVIGQLDFTSDTANVGGSTSAVGMNTPSKTPALGSLYVPDLFNNRVLGYLAVPTTNGAAADFALGQPNLTSNIGGTTAVTLDRPAGVATDGTRLAVADRGNHRVLIWSSLPTTSGVPANVVVGQADFTSSTSGTTAATLAGPEDVVLVDGKLIVLDATNRRILAWNTVPTTNGAPADLVLGQPNFAQATEGTTASSLRRPNGIWSDGTRLAVADSGNNRVLIWTSFPTTNGQAADVVLGQPDFTTSTAAGGAAGLDSPEDVDSNGTQLFIADSGNARILIHDGFPTTNQRAADQVVGQGNFTNTAHDDPDQDNQTNGVPSPRTFDYPTGVLPLGNGLLVNDSDNNRLLIFEP